MKYKSFSSHLRAVIHDDGLTQIPAEDAEILHVVAVHQQTVLAE